MTRPVESPPSPTTGSRGRLLFVNRFYWPDEPATAQLLTDLAEGLAARGWSVQVVTSHAGTPGLPRREQRHGVTIYRVRGPRWGRRHLGGRMVDFAAFLCGAVWRCLRELRRGDTLIAKTDPPFLGVWLWAGARLRRAHLLHWVQDVYPEIAAELAPSRALRGGARLTRGLRNFTWRHSAGCVALGVDMADWIARQGVPPAQISVIGNWAPAGLAPAPAEEVAALRHEWGLDGKFVVAYSGNLGRVHDLDPVLDVARCLRAQPAIVFLFIGHGAREPHLRRRVLAENLGNVRFQPPQPRARLASALGVGDVHLVTLLPSCSALVFPSKLYGIAAVARPIVFIGPKSSGLARQIEQRGMGAAFMPTEAATLAAYLEDLASHPDRVRQQAAAALDFSRTEGLLEHALPRWSARLRDLR